MVNIGRKMLQAQLPAPALQTGKAVVVTSPAASQCWDLNFRVLLASTSQPLSRQNPNVTAFEGYSRLSRMDSLSSQQGLQVLNRLLLDSEPLCERHCCSPLSRR